MNVTAEIGFSINDPDSNPQNTTFHDVLIGNKPITYLLIYITSEINKFIDILYLNTFPSTISYYWTDYNNGVSTVTFTSLLLAQYNPVIVFARDTLKLFNIRQDFPQLISPAGKQTNPIPFDANYGLAFEAWGRVQLFLHASFSEANYN
jgi:hypothetical protein